MQEVFVAGFLLTEVTNTTVKATEGIGSSLAVMNNDFGSFVMDAVLQPGNSGGLDESIFRGRNFLDFLSLIVIQNFVS